MKKFLIKILPILSILLIVGVALVPEVSHAWIEESIQAVVNGFFARISNIILTLASYLVLLSGIFLNQSINLTTHIGDIFNSIPALQEIWVIIRNLSSIFIIFMLLYSSISTILGVVGVGGTNIKSLIKNIIMAGLLINFSLFFVKVGIDASNLVSLQFYRAIAPGASESFRLGDSFEKLGLSNVFMSSLKIPKIYQNNGITKGIDVTASIGLATVMGTGVMLTAALSFFGAAIMFSIRTAILIFVMALSPVFFAGMIFPAIKKEVSDKLLGILKNQLIFMPAYLFLMYVSLKFISSDGFTNIFNAGNGTPGSGGPLGITFIGVLIQYIIALLFINAPLVFAIQLGGIGAKWIPGSKGVGDVAKWFGTAAGGVASRNTYGVLSSKIADSNFMKTAASRNIVMAGALKGMRGIASSYDATNEKTKSERIKFGESLGYNKAAVYSYERGIKSKKDRISTLDGLINNPATAAADVALYKNEKRALNNEITGYERSIVEEKNNRKENYAGRLDPRGVDPATGKPVALSPWERIKKMGYVSQDERRPAAKMSVDVLKDEIKLVKDELEDNKKEQSEIKSDIKELEKKQRNGAITTGETTALNNLRIRLSNFNNKEISPREAIIRDTELEIKRVENLS